MENYRNRGINNNKKLSAVRQTLNNNNGNAHAVCSPSYSSTWLYCPSSIRLGKDIPEPPPNENQIWGVDCHKISAFMLDDLLTQLKSHPNQVFNSEYIKENPLPTDMAPTILSYVSECERQLKSFDNYPKGFNAKTEITLTLNAEMGLFGTADLIATGNIDKNPEGIVIDLKTGDRVWVDATSPQLAFYAAALKQMSKKKLKRVKATIVQPRMNNIQSVIYEAEELDEWKLKFENAAQLVGEQFLVPANEMVFNPGSCCTWCKARSVCSAYAKHLQEKAALDFIDPSATTKDIVPKLSIEDISRLLSSKKQIEDFLEAVNDRACEMILAGETIPGFKVVEGRTHRRWKEEETVAKLVEGLGYEPFSKSLKSPSQLEKELGTRTFENIKKFVVKPEGAPTVVPIADKRAELTRGEEFKEGEI